MAIAFGSNQVRPEKGLLPPSHYKFFSPAGANVAVPAGGLQ